ncbi:MAG: hypothetical protein AAGJ82_07275, partial [Bacteroidota bacterium]
RWRYWQRSSAPPDHHLLSAYREREMDTFFRREERRYRKKLATYPHRHRQYFWQQFQFEEEQFTWQSHQGRAPAGNFKEQEAALQQTFMAYKLRLACLRAAHQNISGEDCAIELLPEILALAQRSPYADQPTISIYYQVYQMQTGTGREAAFQQYQRLLREHLAIFPPEEKRDLLLMGINFCVRRINEKGAIYLRQVLNLYRRGLDNELLLRHGWLSGFTFTNITIAAIGCGEYEWAANFVVDYRPQLPPGQRASIYALNAARVAYASGAHRQALLLLHRFEDKDFFHQMSARLLQLKVYFEGGDFQLLAAHLKNTRAYLRRQSRHPYHRKIYINILSLTEQLMKLPPYDHAKRKQLRKRIETTEPLTERAWLLEQL